MSDAKATAEMIKENDLYHMSISVLLTRAADGT